MVKGVLLYFLLLSVASIAIASPLQEGMNAFSIGDYETAEKILLPIRNSQPSADYLLKIIEIQKKGARKKGASKEIFMRDLFKGNTSKLDQLGMIDRMEAPNTFGPSITSISESMQMKNLFNKARGKESNAAYEAGLRLQEGAGVPQNFKNAADFFKIAADKDHVKALNSLGLYTRYGIGTPKDPVKAKDLLLKAIRFDNAYAFYNLAEMYSEGDGLAEDNLQAFLLADLAFLKLDPQKDKQKRHKAEYLRKTAEKAFKTLQKMYIKKFVPYALADLLPEGYLGDRKYPKKLPLPPANGRMIIETAFMKRLNWNPEDYKNTEILPFLPNWIPFPSDSPKNTRLVGKKLPAPLADSEEMTAALYYRPAIPMRMRMTLGTEEFAMPLRVGDMIDIFVFSSLKETAQSRKGGHKNQNNTDYKMTLSTNGELSQSSDLLFENDEAEETFIGMTFTAQRPGISTLKFTPRSNEVTPHTLRVLIH